MKHIISDDDLSISAGGVVDWMTGIFTQVVPAQMAINVNVGPELSNVLSPSAQNGVGLSNVLGDHNVGNGNLFLSGLFNNNEKKNPC